MKYLMLILFFFLCSCAETNSRNNSTQNRPGHIAELVIGLLDSNDAALKCEQGHAKIELIAVKRNKLKLMHLINQ